MRYNDKELIQFCNENTPKLEGVLQHMKPGSKEWSDWYQQSTFKERYFKLFSNLLFYYKLNDTEPMAVLVLENAHIAYEQKGIPFAFSITFRVNNKVRDNDVKHIFSCRCEADVNKWVSSLRTASYEYWRTQYHILRAKISMKTGDDPVLDYMKNNTQSNQVLNSKSKKTVSKKKASFHSHIGIEFEDSNGFIRVDNYESTRSSVTVSKNLIDL
ncbi:pleckstrin homology domain-containing family J member 1-like [Coccinella septempunctata]|uniref:pleckstrin homology domain-containing family J member 1-like n=1 Tax=Coccinella septempunctata TaxID=41139 RepID=UPI001D0978A1|nr:pleckstrin homology domain-containing family J member 1-like [Coccinella septempunctata]